MNMQRLFALAAVLVTTLVGGAPDARAAQTPAASAGAVPQAAPLAPDFVSLDLAGKPVRLADFKGKLVVLDFWATWCGPCQQAMPHTQELAARYKDDGLVVLAVCTSDARSKFETWVAKNQALYPNIVFTCDPNDRESASYEERASQKLYALGGLPTQIVIGRDGRIAGKLVGYEESGDARAQALLADLGLAVDAALVAQGRAQLQKDAEEAAARALQAAANPAPSFSPRMGARNCGDLVDDFELQGADGTAFKLSSLRGKTLLIGVGFEEVVPLRQLEACGQKFAAKGLLPLAMMVLSPRASFDALLVKSKDSYHFASGWDPAGSYAGDREKLDMQAFAQWESRSALRRLLGGEALSGTPAYPFFAVIDAKGQFVGTCFGGDKFAEGLAILLLRAGVELDAADMPKTVPMADVWAPKADPAPAPEPAVELIAPGALAPDFTTQGLDGEPVRLADYAGKVVVLDFWATWCGPCIASMPHTQEVAARYKEQGVVVLGSCTSDERAKFERWVRDNRSKYPDFVFTHDAAEKRPERASRMLYGVSGIPTQFVIGRDGKIVEVVVGYAKGEVILEGALAKAGIQVDPALVAKAAQDRKQREER